MIASLISKNCCGGPILALNLLCLGIGVFFLALSAILPGLVFMAAGLLTEGLCLYLSRSRCPRQ